MKRATQWLRSRSQWSACALASALLTMSSPVAPVDGTPMLIAEIAGNSYEYRSFGRTGRLTGRVSIEVGGLVERESGVEVPLTITTYDQEDGVENEISSIWTCRSGQDRMVMPLLFLSPDTASRSRILVEGDPMLYPEDPVPGGLPDINLRIEPEKGGFAFFGGRSEIDIARRSVSAPPEGAEHAYDISSSVEVRIYALGIRLRRRRFESLESVAPGRGLVRQVLQRADGGRWVVRLMDDPGPAADWKGGGD